MIQIEYSTNIQRSSISLSTPRYSGTRIVIEIWRIIGFQSGLKIGNFSRVLSKRLNAIFLTRKFKNLLWSIGTYELGKKTQASGYQSYSIQQSTMH